MRYATLTAILLSSTTSMLGINSQASAQNAAALAGPAATGQNSAPADAPEADIIVTGVANPAGQRKLDASFSITTASEELIRETAPISTADLLKIVPGVWVETTGGSTAANVFVRGFPSGGDAPYLSVQVNGSPIYPPPTLSFLDGTALFRLDDTVQRLEVLRGGTSPIFSDGQPGATANFILKKGTATPQGSVRATLGSEGLYRGDFVLQGPVAENTRLMVGGYFATSDGLRNTQFPAIRGGQITASLTHEFDDGEVTIYGRRLEDENTVYIGLPLTSKNGKLSNFPGFSALRDTLVGNDVRRVTIEIAPGNPPVTKSIDSADGRQTRLTTLGAMLNFDVGGFQISNRASYLKGNLNTVALFTGPSPAALADFIAGQVDAANGNLAVLAAAGGPATSGTATFANGGGTVPGTQQVLQAGIWTVEKQLESATNELRVARELFDGNTITLGSYFADYSVDDLWYLGNNALLTAEPNARLVDVGLDNGLAVTRAGFTGSPFFANNASFNGRAYAFYLADDWQITSKLRLDGGLRWERQEATGSLENVSFGTDLDGNPLTLYNNNTAVLNGTYRALDFSDSKVSWTAGASYALTDRLNVFARANRGFVFPHFDQLRDGIENVQSAKQYEVGLKTATSLFDLYLTGFHNRFTGLPFQNFIVNADGSVTNLTRIGGSKTYGLEFEGAIRPFDGLEVAARGVLQNTEFVDFGINSGNRVQRQPHFLIAVLPSYTFKTGFGEARLFATYTHVGKRFSDVENLQPLGAYDTLDLGASTDINDLFSLQVRIENLTNTLALTEGNARVIGGAGDGAFIARPIFGRHATLTAAFRF